MRLNEITMVHVFYDDVTYQQSIYATSQVQHHWDTHSQNRDCSVEERREKSISSDQTSWNLLLHPM